MGVLDKLMFWREKTVDFETDIEGCFTLPGAEIGSEMPGGDACEVPDPQAVADAAAESLDEGGR